MSTKLYITDDGDEVVYFHVNEENVGMVDHGAYGWEGMTEVIRLVENIAEAFGVPVSNTQDIV